MTAYTKEGRYDEAIQLGLNSLENRPTDAFIYEQIVVACIKAAVKEQDQRERWLEQAVIYINRALLVDPDDPFDMRDLQHDLEIAGDISTQNSCSYYKQALQISERLRKVLSENQLTVAGKTYQVDPKTRHFERDGHTFGLEPLVKENDGLSERLAAKTKKACHSG